ncbi:MAG: hypothetical protein ACR2FH_05855 [Caulobacteraceae bacterium]
MAEAARSIEWHYLDDPAREAVGVGERVSAAAGGLPIYKIVAVRGGRAWPRDDHSGADRVAPLTHFHWKASARQ